MGEREQHEAGLSTAEVEELTRRGEVNHAPDDSMRSTWQIVRANLFTRINAIFAILVALVVATGSLRNALFGLPSSSTASSASRRSCAPVTR